MSAAAPSTPSFAVSERIAAVIFALCQTVSMRVRGAAATVTQAQLTYVVGRLLGLRKRFNRLVERIRAGKPPRERARKPRAKKSPPAPDFLPPPRGWRRWAVRPVKPVPPWRSLLPHEFGWLLPLAPSVVGFRESAARHREELLRFLAEPETRALLLASRRVGDTLRPLCWMLGIETSVLYPTRPADAVVPGGDPFALAPSDGNPVLDDTPVPPVAIPGPAARYGIEPPTEPPRARAGGDFFATA